MIEPSKYLPKQMNGPVLNSVLAAIEDGLEDSKEIERYLYTLSINTADEADLQSIGCIIGYPRPLVPEGFNDENTLVLGTLPIATDINTGLSTIDSEIGGVFASVKQSKNNYMDLNLYRALLNKVAYIKRYGITLYSVDEIAKLVSNEYEIKWNANHDVVINFTQSIGYKNIWVLTNLFSRIATEPQVLITSGGE
jgi:hypothetical protein